MKIKSTPRLLILAACVLSPLATARVVFAQATNPPEDALQIQKRADEYLHIISAGAPGFDRTVSGKPFSATAVTETTRVLEDGHRISRRNLMKQYRDRQGRTRREQTLEALGPSTPVAPKEMIFIFDPVLHVSFVIDPEAKVARKFTSPQGSSTAQLAPFSNQAQDNPSSLSPLVRVEDLGTRSVGGLQCSGTRTTTTLPTGLIGNDAPIVTVRETWFSPDIDAVVQSKTVDPRFGTTEYHLTDIKRFDISPDLFRVPASFKVELVPH
jgi:hypothetical protein